MTSLTYLLFRVLAYRALWLRLLVAVLALFVWGRTHLINAQEFAPGELTRQDLPAERSFDFSFSDTDIGKILGRLRSFGISLPLEVQGKISGWVWVQRAAEGWFDFTSYRVEGKVTCPRLVVESWTFESAAIRFGYGNGRWRIGSLSGEVGHVSQEKSLGNAMLTFTLAVAGDEDDGAAAVSEAKLNADFKNLNLAALLGALDLPVKVQNEAGTLTAQGTVATSRLRDLEAWDFTASFTSPWVKLQENEIRDLTVGADLTQGTANLQMRGHAGNGEIQAYADWGALWTSNGTTAVTNRTWPKSASVSLAGIRLDTLALGVGMPLLSGVVNGEWQFARQRNQEDGKLQWSTGGNIRVEQLVVDAAEAPALRLGDVQLEGNKEAARQQFEGTIRLERGVGLLVGNLLIELTGDSSDPAEAQLEYYELDGRLENFLLSSEEFADLPQDFALRASGEFESRGQPANWIEFAELQLQRSPLRIDSQTMVIEKALVQAAVDQFRLPRFEVTAGNQRVLGSAVLRRDNQGEHEARLRVEDLRIDPWVELFAPPAFQSLGGTADLWLQVTKAATEPSWVTGYEGEVAGEIADLRWQERSAGNVRFEGKLTPEQMIVDAVGDILGGAISISSQLLSAPGEEQDSQRDSPPAQTVPRSKTSFKVSNIDLKQWYALMVGESQAAAYAGQFSVEGEVTTVGNQLTEATFDFSLPRLSYQRLPIAKHLQIAGSLTGERLDIQTFRGEIAGGRVNLRGGGELSSTNKFVVDIRGVELGRLVAFVGPELAETMDGRISFRGGVAAYPQRWLLTAAGSGSLQDAQLYGVPMQRIRGMINAEYDIPSGQLGVRSQDLHGEILGGDFTGSADLSGNSRYQLASDFVLSNGDMEELSRSIGFDSVVGQGRFDASGSLGSNDLTSLNRLGGELTLDFDSGSPRSVPLLGDVAKLLPFAQLQSTDINGGLLRARLGGGQARVLDFQVFSEAFFFAAKGKIGLAGGQLDLNVLLQTGGGWQQQIGSQALLQLAPQLVPQIALINEAAALIRNRTVYAHIAGTTSRPVVQPRIVGTLGRAVVQNLVRQLVGFSAATAATVDQN